MEAGKIKEFLKRKEIRRIHSFFKVIQALSPYGENSYELQETKENPEFQVEGFIGLENPLGLSYARKWSTFVLTHLT